MQKKNPCMSQPAPVSSTGALTSGLGEKNRNKPKFPLRVQFVYCKPWPVQSRHNI